MWNFNSKISTIKWNFLNYWISLISISEINGTIILSVFNEQINWCYFHKKWKGKIIENDKILIIKIWKDIYNIKNINIINQEKLNILNNDKIKWKKTDLSENDLRDYYYKNIYLLKNILKNENYVNIAKEYVIDWLWRIDILWKINKDTYIIFEFKKHNSSYNAIEQCLRYIEHFEENWFNAIGIVLVKEITKEHEFYAKECWIKIISIN